MSTSSFQKLLALVSFDAALAAKRAERVQLSEQLNQKYQELDELEKIHETHKNDLLTARKAVDSIELEMKTIEQRESRKKKLIDTAHNLKEFNSAKAELAAVHEDLIDQEKAVVEAWDILEQMQRALAAFETTYPARRTEIQQKITVISDQISSLDTELAQREAERPVIVAEVPAEWTAQYATMHAAVADPVVPTYDDSCTACFSPIPSQWAGRIKRGAILPCKGCFRLLYDPAIYTA
jgi:predicted  nucleic acid-binding Zn-ribbon protein